MTIPISTTLISITRIEESPDTDGYDTPPSPTSIAANVRARITQPSANVALSGGDRIVYTAYLWCDPTDLKANDTIVETDGTEWRLLWVKTQKGLGLDHMNGQLRLVTGAI